MSIIALLLLMSVGLRMSTYVLMRHMQSVIAGLSKLEIDKSSEQELVRLVPELERGKFDEQVKPSNEAVEIEAGLERFYSVTISNEPLWMKFYSTINFLKICSKDAQFTHDGYLKGCFSFVPDLLGFRYVYFGASVVLLDGRVSSIRYGVADRLDFPRQFGEIVSARSVHSFWASYRRGFEVTSTDDESPQFRVGKGTSNLGVTYTFDAPLDLVADAFKVNLDCFWSLRGCRTPAQIATALAQDAERIQAATLARLQSADPCPARIVAGRTRYLTDLSVSLVESEGLRQEPTNLEGSVVVRAVTDDKLIELLRGSRVQSLKSMVVRPSVPFPGDYSKQLPNYGPQWPERGKQILLFSNHHFDSCQLVTATPEAIAAIRNEKPASKRIEDQTGLSLQ